MPLAAHRHGVDCPCRHLPGSVIGGSRMHCMVWSARSSIAILLALAFATVPPMLDRCTASCEHTRGGFAVGTDVSSRQCPGGSHWRFADAMRTRPPSHAQHADRLGCADPPGRGVCRSSDSGSSGRCHHRYEPCHPVREPSARSSVPTTVRFPPHLALTIATKY